MDKFNTGLPELPGFGAANKALTEGWQRALSGLSGMALAPEAVLAAQKQYLLDATELWNRLAAGPDAKIEPPKADRRFAGEAWAENPAAALSAQLYALNARTMLSLADAVQGDEKTRERVRFAVQQFIDATAPSNVLALNPEALRKAVDTQGQSLAAGVQHLLHDLRQGHLSQTDESVFEVGRNLATTPGTVVFENAVCQLIEYVPTTEKVRKTPLLIVPPCINKYYILDLQPENSFVRHAVAAGHRVFLVSWVNADESLAETTWDDYVEQGVIGSIEAVRSISKQSQINTLGFCVGGTLLTTGLAVYAARGEKPCKSMTLLTSFLDFSDTGILDLFVDEQAVALREMTIGKRGLLKGRELAATFSFLRPNELVWNYVVGNYLKGETPPAFDLLYWNSDSTNLPGPMYCWYLRNTYLENNLKKPGKAVVCGERVDLGKLDMPVFLYASREDHIVPWESAYESVNLLPGPKTFVLGASGHIAGVVNPPAKKKRSHWTNAHLVPSAQDWLAEATEEPGSWWPGWLDWLDAQAGALVAAPAQAGNSRYPALEPAPGRYARVRHPN